ncbi:MAG: histidine phosphatase family protein [Nakamurella sp.]
MPPAEAGTDDSAQRPPRTLVLLRHGKSAYPPGVSDHDRPLAPRGRRGAALAGAWITDHLPVIDHVLCSTAERARQTLAASGLQQPSVLVDYTDEIYDADPEELLALVTAASRAERTLLMVGHAPGIPALAKQLAGPDSDQDAAAQLGMKFPTAAIAVLRLGGDWADATTGSAALTYFGRPNE